MITVIYCTKEHNPEHTEHIKKLSGSRDIEVIEYINNNEGLTKPYNKCLTEAKYDIVVFMHDDVEIMTKNFAKKVVKHFERNPEYGIIGAAGGKNIPASGKWWETPRKMYGRVYHTHEGKTWLSGYSPDQNNRLVETAMVDGLFFAVNKPILKANFDESVKGFHFYEITFCMQNYLEGLKIGVFTDIKLNHMSIGATNQEWEDNRVTFSEKFADSLPVNVDISYEYNKIKVLLYWPYSNGDGKELIDIVKQIKALEKNNCDVILLSDIGTEFINRSFKGIKAYNVSEPLGFKIGDGMWALNGPNGAETTQVGALYRIKEVDLDVVHVLNSKDKSQSPTPIEYIQKLYPNTPMVTDELEDAVKEYEIAANS